MRLYYLYFALFIIFLVLGDEDVIGNKGEVDVKSSSDEEKDNIVSEKQTQENIVIDDESTVPINNVKVVQENVSGNKYNSFSEDQNNNRDDEKTISDIRKEAEKRVEDQEKIIDSTISSLNDENHVPFHVSDNDQDSLISEGEGSSQPTDYSGFQEIESNSEEEENVQSVDTDIPERPLDTVESDQSNSEEEENVQSVDTGIPERPLDTVESDQSNSEEEENVQSVDTDIPERPLDTVESDQSNSEDEENVQSVDTDIPERPLDMLETDIAANSEIPEPPDFEHEFDVNLDIDSELLDSEKDAIVISGDSYQEPEAQTTDPKSDPVKTTNGNAETSIEETTIGHSGDNMEVDKEDGSVSQQEATKPSEENAEIDEVTKLYNEGKEFEKIDKKKYKKKLLSAAELGHTKAMEEIAYSLLYGDDIRANESKAFEYFQKLADNGSPVGQQGLGYLFSTGLHGNSSQAKALIYTTFSALGGDTMAEMMLGYRHYSGNGVQKSCETALTYYKKVAKKVSDTASSYIGSNAVQRVRLYDELEQPGGNSGQIDEDLLQYYQFLADKGDTQAQIGLGQLYFQGGRGVEINHKKAFQYFDMAANAGNSNGNAYIGKMYLQGLHVDKDPSKAHEYFQKSVNGNSAIGQAGLGMIYLKGEGVKKDYAKALKYFSQSAEQGWVEGQLQLGNMYYNGIGVKKDYRQAVKYFTFASQSGHVLAFYNLAMMHTIGAGVMRSCTAATELFKNVAERGKWAVIFMDAHDAYKNGDMKTALMKYYYLAELGYEVAQSNVAYILDKDDVNFFSKNQTYARALLQWSRAAEQGYAVARVKVGDYYFYGLGTNVNYEIAALHYRLASDKQRNAQAMFNLGYMHEQGFGLKKDIHLAKRFYDMAAEASPDAQFPVYLALSKLGIEFAMEWSKKNFRIWESIDTSKIQLTVMQTIGPDWDIYLITLLTGILGLLLLFRRGLRQ